MIWYSIKTTLRNIARNKSYFLINILGLTLSLAAVITITFWIKIELGTDNFHEEAERIFCVANISKTPNQDYHSSSFYAPAGAEFKQTFPKIEKMSRVFFMPSTIKKEQSFFTEKTMFAEPDFFDIFSFNLIQGNAISCLTGNGVVLTEQLAHKLFGNENPIGKTLLVENKPKTISGVLQNLPTNTDFAFNLILPTQQILDDKSIFKGWNGGIQFHTFLKISETTNADELQQKIVDYVNKNVNAPRQNDKFTENPYLQPLKAIHLSPDISIGGSIAPFKLWITGVIGLLILLIGIFNFINLSVALLDKRALNFGIRKVHGVRGKQIFGQVYSEIAVTSALAFGLGIALFYIAQPLFVKLLDKRIELSTLNISDVIVVGLLLLASTIFISGYFPARKFSRQMPITNILKNKKNTTKKRGAGGIISFQFAVSIVLIAVVLTFYKQFNYIDNYKLGFNNENIVNLKIGNGDDKKLTAFKNELLNQTFVTNVSAATNLPYDGNWVSSNGYMPEGMDDWMMIHVIDADKDYLNALGITLEKGTFFKGNTSDKNTIVVNQSLVNKLGWENPIGKKIKRGRNTLTIKGVVNDFTINSLHHQIEPLLITSIPFEGYGSFNNLAVKLTENSNKKEVIARIRPIWNSFYPETPIDFHFIEEVNDLYYGKERKANSLLLTFSLLAIFIACLGLFTMAHLKAQQRTKEIGIRKVNGATIPEILTMLNRDLIKRIPRGSASGYRGKFENLKVFMTF